jgi:hypothetical protein
MAACVIVSMVAMGTYGLVGQALRIESTANRQARARALLAPVADHLAGVIRQACETGIDDLPAISAGPGTLTLTTVADAQGRRERRRYTWSVGADKLSVEMKSFLCAGTEPLALVQTRQADESGIWSALVARTVAGGLEQLKVEFRDPKSLAWRERYEGSADAAARITVEGLGQQLQRVVVAPGKILGIGPRQDDEEGT